MFRFYVFYSFASTPQTELFAIGLFAFQRNKLWDKYFPESCSYWKKDIEMLENYHIFYFDSSNYSSADDFM